MRSVVITALLLLFVACVDAQDTLPHVLDEALISSNRYETSQNGYKVVRPDTLIRKQFSGFNLSDIISYENTFFIKNYGANGIASTAIRGGTAAQSTINWNGFNINNPMLGQSDLSILPAFFFNDVSIAYGGNACLAGSGSIGGTVYLRNNYLFQKNLSFNAFSNYTSFGTYRNGVALQVSNTRITNNTKIFINSGNNNFSYGDTINGHYTIQNLHHTRILQYGLLQENNFKINKYQKLSLNLWLQSSDKQLPNRLNEAGSMRSQYDAASRNTLNWQLTKEKYSLFARTALFLDKIDYTDSLSSIFSKSHSLNSISEIETKWRVNNNNTLDGGINYNYQKGYSVSYSQNPCLAKLAGFASWSFQNTKKWFTSTLNVRQELVSTGQKPFVYNMGVNVKVLPFLTLRGNAGKLFRIPTLNDMYWSPGGNPNLKPEQGYSEEIGGTINKHFNKADLMFDIAYFNRNITNWIAWLPSGGSYWTPVNILQVWSRGCETQSSIAFSLGKFKVHDKLITNYILSTYQKAINENDESPGRQLIYTPMYSGSNTFTIAYKNIALLYNISYTGYRYLSSDNYQYLTPYWLHNASLNYKLNYKNTSSNLFISVDNLSNTNYQVVASNPMPLRYFRAGINFKYNKKHNNK